MEQSLETKETKKTFGKKVFNVIDLTKATTKANKSVKTDKKTKTSYKPTAKKKELEVEQTIGERSILSIEDSSIQQYLNTCHPEIRDFVAKNEIKVSTAKCGELIIVTKNNLRVHIKTITENSRKVVITDKKKNILFNDITKFTYKKEVAA